MEDFHLIEHHYCIKFFTILYSPGSFGYVYTVTKRRRRRRRKRETLSPVTMVKLSVITDFSVKFEEFDFLYQMVSE